MRPPVCPRCGGAVRAPDLFDTQWRCSSCGSVAPLHIAPRVSAEALGVLVDRARRSGDEDPTPVWCPWPLPPGWTVTGMGWAGDDRRPPRATAVAISGPIPFGTGPADVVFVAEELGVGLGAGLGGLVGVDPGPALSQLVAHSPPHAKVRVERHPTPLWAVAGGPGRSVFVGEARAGWLYAIAWPPAAAYLLADSIVLHDLAASLPSELVYGADSDRLRPRGGVADMRH